MLQVDLIKQLHYFELQVDFQVQPEEILVLWGPSGSGKTTILECLAGLCRPDAGSIRLNGQLLYEKSSRLFIPARHRNIGYLFQNYALFPHLTVEQNVRYGLKRSPADDSPDPKLNYKELLEVFGISHLAGRHPRQLSGGEKQRAAMVRALVRHPALLLLDEPFSALDRASRLRLREELLQLHQRWRIPMIIVSHDDEEACHLGDQIISLEQGQIQSRRRQ